jgi:hypothetical protein
VVLVSLTPHKFVHPPCCYYQLSKIKKCEFGVASNGIISILHLIKICLVVLELKEGQMDRYDKPYMN